jgi:hypothetical protein
MFRRAHRRGHDVGDGRKWVNIEKLGGVMPFMASAKFAQWPGMSKAQVRRDLFDLLRSYAALVPPKLLSFPSHIPLPEIHDFLLHHLLLNDHLKAYPPSTTYQRAFWKWAIDHLNSESVEAAAGQEARSPTRSLAGLENS